MEIRVESNKTKANKYSNKQGQSNRARGDRV